MDGSCPFGNFDELPTSLVLDPSFLPFAHHDHDDASTLDLYSFHSDHDISFNTSHLLTGYESADPDSQQDTPPPTTRPRKRFSSTSVRVLRNWLVQHMRHPYPNVGEIEALQKQSGLDRQQILTWFANARRRTKFRRHQYTAVETQHMGAAPLDIPRPRPSTPAPSQMDPLQRWQNSPPEDEPANAAAIARAVSGLPPIDGISSGIIRPTAGGRVTSTGHISSISSTGTSDSSQSCRSSQASAYSFTSQNSKQVPPFLRKTRKRRRRVTTNKLSLGDVGASALLHACHLFQCTFCTETFKTKHTWQRHEKSLHLSLEQWQCSPLGPIVIGVDSKPTCVYCGHKNPDREHLDIHNYAACEDRLREERSFSRKDHLRQHLRLVHRVPFIKWPMDEWKIESGEIRSRCGFCNLNMHDWAERADHLAEHFKDGETMAHWEGDWGFERPVLEMVENAMPPCECSFNSSDCSLRRLRCR